MPSPSADASRRCDCARERTDPGQGAADQADPASPRNPKTHSEGQLQQLVESIRTYGFTVPVLVGGDDQPIAGHGQLVGHSGHSFRRYRCRCWVISAPRRPAPTCWRTTGWPRPLAGTGRVAGTGTPGAGGPGAGADGDARVGRGGAERRWPRRTACWPGPWRTSRTTTARTRRIRVQTRSMACRPWPRSHRPSLTN